RRGSHGHPAHALWGRRGGLRDRLAAAAARAHRTHTEVSDAHGPAVLTSRCEAPEACPLMVTSGASETDHRGDGVAGATVGKRNRADPPHPTPGPSPVPTS